MSIDKRNALSWSEFEIILKTQFILKEQEMNLYKISIYHFISHVINSDKMDSIWKWELFITWYISTVLKNSRLNCPKKLFFLIVKAAKCSNPRLLFPVETVRTISFSFNTIWKSPLTHLDNYFILLVHITSNSSSTCIVGTGFWLLLRQYTIVI